MKRQGLQSTLLTLLAAIYLPLSLVTSTFGMNVKEINGGSPPFWYCVVVLGLLAILTAAVYFGYRWFYRKRDARRAAERTEESKVYKIA